MNNIPDEFKKLAESPELYDQSEKIGEKFGLHIDQIGELDAEIRDILTGTVSSDDFIEHIQQRLEISGEKAAQITEEVNREVFQAVKRLLQSQAAEVTPQTQAADNSTSSFEKAGNLSIEQTVRDDNRPTAPVPADLENKENILNGIENPQPGNEKISRKEGHEYREPLMDHLMQTPVAQPQKKSALFSTGLPNNPIQPATPPAPTPAPEQEGAPTTLIQPPPPSKRSGPDPYKEPIE
jgi:hypothetical protein